MGDLPDFTTRSDVNITAQTIDNLTVLAPSAEAVNICPAKTIVDEFYDTVAPGYSKTIAETDGRGKFLALIITFKTQVEGAEENWNNISLRIDIDGSTWWSSVLSDYDRFFGNHYLTYYTRGLGAGTYHPLTTTSGILAYPVLKLVSTQPTSGTGLTFEVLAMVFRPEIEFTAETNSSRIIVTVYSDASQTMIVDGVYLWGPYL